MASRPKLRRRLWLIALLLLTACGAPLAITPTPSATSGTPTTTLNDLKQALPGRIAFTRGDGALWLVRPTPGMTPQKLLSAPAGLIATYPSWSHDGRRLAYGLMNMATASGFPESDLYVAQADGRDARLLLAHQRSGEQLSAPAWSLDDRAIYFSRLTLVYQNQSVSGARREIVRLDLQTQQRTVVLSDGHQASLSPRGDQMAFIHVDPITYQQSLWLSDVDGRAPRAALDQPARGVLLSPRFAPDGQTLVVASSSLLSAHTLQSFGINFVGIAQAHGDPFDLWTVELRAKSVRRLTQVGEDMPHAAWSADGRWIAFVGAAGVYVVEADGQNLQLVTRMGGHGQIDWTAEERSL